MKKIVLHIKTDQTKLRNEFHFDVQRTTRSNVFRNKKAYTRKRKHKAQEDE